MLYHALHLTCTLPYRQIRRIFVLLGEPWGTEGIAILHCSLGAAIMQLEEP